MPREVKPTAPKPDADKVSPSRKPRSPSKSASSAEVKVHQGRITQTVPKKSPAKAPASRSKAPAKAVPAKPAAKAKTERKGSGTTVIQSSAKLSKKQQEALEAGALQGLDARQAKFVDLWLVSNNGTQSYIDAGFEVKSDQVAAAAASRLLRKVKDHPYTKSRRAALLADTEEVQNRVLEVIFDTAFADARDLVEYRYFCCRYCHGKDFKYQFTPRGMADRKREHAELVAQAKAAKTKAPGKFDEEGGLGFNKWLPPHPDCPECSGTGHERIVIKDTSNLSPAAMRLFGGVKPTKEGPEVKVKDQLPYIEMLARLYGMEVERKVKIEAGVTEEELNSILANARAKTRAQREEMDNRFDKLNDLLAKHGAGAET